MSDRPRTRTEQAYRAFKQRVITLAECGEKRSIGRSHVDAQLREGSMVFAVWRSASELDGVVLKVNVGELAHADGEVLCRVAIGDLDLAPGLVGLEEDEQVGRPIALILAVVALDLARLGRDRLMGLTDELGGALIETDHRAFRIGLFGVELEHILHAGDIFAVDLRNTPHVLAPRL